MSNPHKGIEARRLNVVPMPDRRVYSRQVEIVKIERSADDQDNFIFTEFPFNPANERMFSFGLTAPTGSFKMRAKYNLFIEASE